MTKTCEIVIIGAAGYGEIYLEALQKENRLSWIKGIVDVHPERSAFFSVFRQMNIPIYNSVESFYEVNTADLAIIATPIHLHAQQAITAMLNGSNVLCEKPVSGSLQEAEKMREVEHQTNRFLAIGFNWSFSESVHQLKEDIIAGLYGEPICGKTVVLWPRNEDYYNRSNWAGKLFGPNNEPIFDSIANNATSHFFHHLFFVLGEQMEQSAKVNKFDVELYRANSIETFDTCAIRAKTDKAVKLLYFASHAVDEEYGPVFELEFEKAIIQYKNGGPIKATFTDGTEKYYDDPEKEHINKLNVCIKATMEGHKEICCSIDSAYSHLLGIHYMHEAFTNIPFFPSNEIKKNKDRLTYVQGLAASLKECYRQQSLPSELNFHWAEKYKSIIVPKGSYPY
ncbi:Gfo/Idh/MocA family protein [Oceanobacillus timonensis]|uniref:Gfo/Idh/MocA family protein n=1 Tax=Oceanobacillus timonensis TaxID=1926285 RepID=UPI0009BA2A8D|nr:Gfo/Idh/MocA family oxidoreductase [Oceanobacillus timonensis]